MDGDEGDGDGGVLVEEQVFDYVELRDLCEAHPHKTSYEHYPPHVVVLDDENTDDTDDYGEGFEDDDIIAIDTNYYEEV